MGRTAPRRPGPLPRGGSPAVHGVHHPPRDVHFPERAQHALTAVWPAGQADDEDLEEAGEVGARSGCTEWVPGRGGPPVSQPQTCRLGALTSSNPILVGLFGGRDT